MSTRAARALAAACEAALPFEACGFLLGMRQPGGAWATEIVTARSASTEGEFEIADAELRRIVAWAEERRLDILALFHSHPSGERCLSAADRAALRYSQWPWVVVTASQAIDPPVALTCYRAGDARRAEVRVAEAITAR